MAKDKKITTVVVLCTTAQIKEKFKVYNTVVAVCTTAMALKQPNHATEFILYKPHGQSCAAGLQSKA